MSNRKFNAVALVSLLTLCILSLYRTHKLEQDFAKLIASHDAWKEAVVEHVHTLNKELLRRKKMKYAVTVFSACLLLAVLSSCSSTYVPTQENYREELEEILGKHEDNALINYGEPNRIMELAEGWKVLVYTEVPYSVSPLTETKKYTKCVTKFVVSPNSKIEKIRADGNFCVR